MKFFVNRYVDSFFFVWPGPYVPMRDIGNASARNRLSHLKVIGVGTSRIESIVCPGFCARAPSYGLHHAQVHIWWTQFTLQINYDKNPRNDIDKRPNPWNAIDKSNFLEIPSYKRLCPRNTVAVKFPLVDLCQVL